MKRHSKKLLGALLVLVLLLSTLAGCSPDTPESSSATPSTTEPAGDGGEDGGGASSDLDPVELKIFAIADAPRNQEMAAEYFPILNEELTKALNVTVKFDYAAGNDYQNNYQMIMASGDKYDIIQSARWLNYATNAKKNAFMDLTELLPEYAPDVYAMVGEDRWNEVKVDGAIYGVPSLRSEPVEPSFMYREDLRKKYGTPEIDSFEAIEAYLQAIKDNEPELLPSDDYQAQVYGASFIPSSKYIIVDEGADRHSNFVIDPANPREVLNTLELPEFKEFMYMMQDWADRGFWPKSVLSSTDWGVFAVQNGKAAASFNGQFPNYAYLATQLAEENESWEIMYAPYCLFNDNTAVLRPKATGGMFSVTRTANNPERALMLANYVHTHEDLWRLMIYGIEDVHYKDVNGTRDISFIDQTTEGFNYFPGSLFDNADFYMPLADQWYKQDEIMEKITARQQTDILSGYVLEVEPVEAQYTAVNQVRIEYGFPLQAGLVDDVDAAWQTFYDRSMDAGLEECRQEIERQINEYLDSIGY